MTGCACADWLEGEFPALPVFRPFTGAQVMRVEDYLEGGDHVLRAELPGINPEKDVDITVDDGVLRVSAERREEKKEAHRSEFRYGAFTRSVALPAEADEEAISATYAHRLLEVRVGIKAEQKTEPKRITVDTT